MDEFERRQCAYFEQVPARRAARQQRAALFRWKRRRAAFRREDILNDRHELMLPAPQGVGVAFAEAGERLDGAVDIGPPFEHAAVARQQRHIELRLDIMCAMALQFEIGNTTASQ